LRCGWRDCCRRERFSKLSLRRRIALEDLRCPFDFGTMSQNSASRGVGY
jgi:hypothetical protein